MSKLELILLGQFECLLPSGTRISLSMRKAEVLLAYLALTPGLRHPRERLINLLWSDRSEEQARNSLRQCLSAIKKSLGAVADMVLQVDRTTVSLIPQLIDIDVHEFERLAAEGDYESLTTAADLYQGEFLEGISIRDASCQEWLDSERGRFKRQFIEILSELAETQLLSHDFRNAIKSTERLVKQDPLGESGWRLLMRSYYEHGDRNHALMAFKRCSDTLLKELDVEPEAATAELRDQIAGGEASPAPTPVTKPPVDSTASTEHSIAVLPFDNLSGDPEQEYFSDGITDSIILNLSLFPGLQVKSRNSSFAFKQQIKSIGEISKELEVDYIVEGSIRKSADRIRITVQLIEAASGNQVWGKRYDADIDNLFDLEEDLSRSIAATVTGQIESDLQRIAVAKGAAGQESYDLLLSGVYHAVRFNRQDSLIGIEKLNQCLAQDPDNVRAHVHLYSCHSMNHLERWVEDYKASFKLAAEHIQRALSLDPESALVQAYYAEYLIFNGEKEKALKHINKALEINPGDPDAMAVMAVYLELNQDFEAGLEMAERSYRLDPYHPWVEWELAVSRYFCGQYEATLETIENARTSPSFTRIFSVAANIKLGRTDAAKQELQAFLRQCRENMLSMPATLDEWTRYIWDNYLFADPRYNRDIIDCLLQAGLEEALAPQPVPGDSDDMTSIAVLPFENMSDDPEQEYFSDGITTSVILGLGLFEGLNVKSQQTSFAFRNSASSSEEIANELCIDYLVEGSIRKSGSKVRISVQLIEAETDSQIWGKQYNEELEDILELEQELSQTIAATISGRIGHKLQQSAVRKPAKDLKSYDYLLRGLYHFGKFTADDLVIAKEQIQQCIGIDPDNAIAHTNLAMLHSVELLENWSTDREKSGTLASQHFHFALELEPDNALTHAYAAEHLYWLREYEQSEFHCDKAIELNPHASEGYTAKADLLAGTGRIDEAINYADQCIRLDPHSVGSGWVAGEVYLKAGQYEKAIKVFRSISHPPASIHAHIAVCFASMGLPEEARSEMKQYLKLAKHQMTEFPRTEQEWRSVWRAYLVSLDDEGFKAHFDKLLAAGLCDDLIDATDEMPSIAVLPFENMSGDPEQEHFADGITTDIIATLTKFRHMRTIARYSILQYKDQKTSIADIAEQQKVRYILEGSVRKSGEHIRVSAQLIDAQNDQVCWSERFDRDLDDLFAVQDEITLNIALAMKVQLDDGDMAIYRSRGTTNIRAWELIMTAIDLQDTYIRQNILDARAMANEAIRLDPDYAYAWLTLAWSHWQECYICGGKSINAFIDAAEKANAQARSLDPDYAEVWSQAGLNYLMRHDAEAALASCRKAVELEPGSAEINALMAFACVFAGDYELALKYNQNIRKLCPVMANWYFLIEGQVERIAGNFDRAATIYRQGLEIEPDSPLCRFYLVDVMMNKGDPASAQAYADEIRALDNTVRGHGLVHSFSSDPDLRERFAANLAKFDLL